MTSASVSEGGRNKYHRPSGSDTDIRSLRPEGWMSDVTVLTGSFVSSPSHPSVRVCVVVSRRTGSGLMPAIFFILTSSLQTIPPNTATL